jgi:hypothetical protein
MSDQQLAKELKARNVLAERISAVLQQRQKIGAARRTHEREYQRLNNERALARHYRLSGAVLTQQLDGHPESAPCAILDVHANTVAERAVQPYLVHLRWNSVNGSTV